MSDFDAKRTADVINTLQDNGGDWRPYVKALNMSDKQTAEVLTHSPNKSSWPQHLKDATAPLNLDDLDNSIYSGYTANAMFAPTRSYSPYNYEPGGDNNSGQWVGGQWLPAGKFATHNYEDLKDSPTDQKQHNFFSSYSHESMHKEVHEGDAGPAIRQVLRNTLYKPVSIDEEQIVKLFDYRYAKTAKHRERLAKVYKNLYKADILKDSDYYETLGEDSPITQIEAILAAKHEDFNPLGIKFDKNGRMAENIFNLNENAFKGLRSSGKVDKLSDPIELLEERMKGREIGPVSEDSYIDHQEEPVPVDPMNTVRELGAKFSDSLSRYGLSQQRAPLNEAGNASVDGYLNWRKEEQALQNAKWKRITEGRATPDDQMEVGMDFMAPGVGSVVSKFDRFRRVFKEADKHFDNVPITAQRAQNYISEKGLSMTDGEYSAMLRNYPEVAEQRGLYINEKGKVVDYHGSTEDSTARYLSESMLMEQELLKRNRKKFSGPERSAAGKADREASKARQDKFDAEDATRDRAEVAVGLRSEMKVVKPKGFTINPNSESAKHFTPNQKDWLKNPGYYTENKGYTPKLMHMPPETYQEFARAGESVKGGYDNGLVKPWVEEIMEMMRKGEEFPPLELDYRYGSLSQEGRHRAEAARRLGIEKVPVITITPHGKIPKPTGFIEGNLPE
jgi:hypothetical protein